MPSGSDIAACPYVFLVVIVMLTGYPCFDILVRRLCIPHKEFVKNCTCTLPFQPLKWNCSGFSCNEMVCGIIFHNLLKFEQSPIYSTSLIIYFDTRGVIKLQNISPPKKKKSPICFADKRILDS